jgi:hypothetical protein
MRVIRGLAFVIMLISLVSARQAGLLAEAFQDFCTAWGCTCEYQYTNAGYERIAA